MNDEIISILEKVPKEILIYCAEKLMSKWIRFYDEKNDFFEFSNFYKAPMIIDGKKYKTVEHYFQAQKYANDLGDNLAFMELIRTQNTGGQAKMLANPIKNARYPWQKKIKELRDSFEDTIFFDHEEWNKIRDKVMLTGLIAKFNQNLHCRQTLLSTGDAILSEHTSRDNYWGSGGDPNKIGKLGELLMDVRKELIKMQE